MTFRDLMRRAYPLVCLLTLTALGATASAVIGISPLRMDVYARPGIAQEFQITVINTTPSPRDVTLRVRGLSVDENGDEQIIDVDAANTTPPEDEETFGGRQNPRGQGTGDIITFPEGNQLTLAPNEARQVTCFVTLPSNATTEALRMVVVDPGPEELPIYGNTNRRIAITFRVGAQIFIIPGERRQIPLGNGDFGVEIVRENRPFYDIGITDIKAITPQPGEEPVLKVEGVLQNRSNTFVQPLIQAQLRSKEKRTVVEERVLDHGFNLVLGNSIRRFRGSFTSPLEPGEYTLTVTVPLEEESRPYRQSTDFTITEPIAGTGVTTQGVINLDPGQGTIRIRPGKTVRGEFTVRNNYAEPLRIEPSLSEGSAFEEWFSFSPRSPVIRPNTERTFRVTVRADREASQTVSNFSIYLTPQTATGDQFLDTETREFGVTLQVLPPPERRER
ncbi:MAG: hypothetical protein O3A46_12220 [Candidatus Poribacteria bacterium]|nr:hypothetical protein [Candidatus Poribacteria bacterium]